MQRAPTISLDDGVAAGALAIQALDFGGYVEEALGSQEIAIPRPQV